MIDCCQFKGLPTTRGKSTHKTCLESFVERNTPKSHPAEQEVKAVQSDSGEDEWEPASQEGNPQCRPFPLESSRHQD